MKLVDCYLQYHKNQQKKKKKGAGGGKGIKARKRRPLLIFAPLAREMDDPYAMAADPNARALEYGQQPQVKGPYDRNLH